MMRYNLKKQPQPLPTGLGWKIDGTLKIDINELSALVMNNTVTVSANK